MRLSVRIGGGRVMPDVFSMYRNDLSPTFYVDLFDYDPVTGILTPADLSAVGTTVGFRTRPITGGPLRTDATLSPINASQGKFQYDWVVNDTAVADKFMGEITVTYPGSPNRPRTVRQFELHILEDLP